MILLNPWGLVGLLSLPVILALHLINRRKRRYIVSHLGLWNFLDAQTRGPQPRRMPLTLLLLLDLLIGALLSLAWSRPSVVIAQPDQAPHQRVILIDTSTSMRARDSGTTSRFDQAKDEAERLIRAATPNDVVTVITFGQEARIIADSRQGSIPATGRPAEGQNTLAHMTQQMRQAKAGETGSALEEALALGQSSLDGKLPVEFHIFTDGSYSLPDLARFNQFAYPITWHFTGGPANNQAVIELNTTRISESQVQVFARLANFGDQEVTRAATLQVDDKIINQANILLPAGSSVAHVWQINVQAGDSALSVALAGQDALSEDDSASVGLQAGGKIRVALVAEDPALVEQALQVIPAVDLKAITPGDYANQQASEMEAYDLTIFRHFLPAQWPAGRVLIIDPPDADRISGVAPGAEQFAARSQREIPAGSVVRAEESNPLVRGVDFSGVRWGRVWTLDTSSSPALTPILQANETPILLGGQVRSDSGGITSVILLLADLTQGNFTKHPAYPILMANLVENSRQAPLPAGFKTGEALPLPAQGAYTALEITPPRGQPVQMANAWPAQWAETTDPGVYRFRLTSADGSAVEYTTGAQAGDSQESDLHPQAWIQSITTQNHPGESRPTQEADRVDLRHWLLGAAILILLLEAYFAWRR